ncbi:MULTISPECIES: acyl-ACP--UDP-N-acetylglucosamine O-acyltransferase [Acinetobacter]|jgi:acyl-[acyl-carrier-protein]--UDP-N-acetylglucosamine O-acyltransferase|uniref:Acyl-[acyl-carrier-protein]--UDP-N-acetylglucosamine O-acyltransferase n=2 Tax=Acinetobacter calcoaceticus/baumannii complex TaxID=909768 RepID=A0A4Y5QBB2_ACIBA|nr:MULTISPECIES: acyl-ACP--UDP-N-acetylglucosamine O-acyltransferase [Acinetobacter]QCX19915.1 UDP-acetylglucosamine acyltransferase [Acinetobacter baumannii]MBJ8505129.1 acyl-ACP--UDP-N-acetylglucosamine O-acyltransferase [Acinetobacter seifertii]MBZ6533651.1 acyl-ACP--UDP-N-acetylglucosamine O-acyltransferase [Acinetobacter seifertii]MDK4791186.1 acyl-ACP--UDP-N-acetylglucosamine O-acyltransferase [Acinetobacter sp.]NUE91680.1 acyl-ACP--UDP-N-acetylglucosamine O-acyltransferase [Acinetobacte
MSNHDLIHSTAIIDPSAVIAADVQIGPYCVIGPQVTIGAGTKLHSHVVVGGFTRIGQNNEIFQFASVGEVCQDLKYKGEETWLEIGNYNLIREHCSLHRGTVQDNALTKIGSHNLLMVNTHIAHDCIVGDHNIFANNVGVAGHVHIGDHVIVGGNSGIHQFCKIDSYSMIGGASLILKDVPAYVMASGNPAHAFGINTEGMRRKGWSKNTIQGLREAYKLIFKSGLTSVQAVEQIKSEILPSVPEAQLLIDSIEQSERGIVR